MLADHVHGRRAGDGLAACVASGAIGTVRVAYAEVNWGRIETWHPRPEPFYADRAARRRRRLPAHDPDRDLRPGSPGDGVRHDRAPRPDDDGRRARSRSARPTSASPLIELEDGTVVRLTTSFYVGQQSKQRGIEFHGDTGSLFLSSWQDFDAAVELAPVRRRVRAGARAAAPSVASTGARRSQSSPRRSPRSARTARPGRTQPTSSRSSTRSRPRASRVARSRVLELRSPFRPPGAARPPGPGRQVRPPRRRARRRGAESAAGHRGPSTSSPSRPFKTPFKRSLGLTWAPRTTRVTNRRQAPGTASTRTSIPSALSRRSRTVSTSRRRRPWPHRPERASSGRSGRQ